MIKLRKWWGVSFLKALEKFTEPARLTRGRTYANNGSVTEFKIDKNCILATVEGSINPYFGVYQKPTYKIKIELAAIAESAWQQIIKAVGSNAGWVIKLLMNEMPEEIEEAFSKSKNNLLPMNQQDFITTNCSCPDYAVPCKHIAAVYYCVAYKLDQDPFLLFQLRGITHAQLLQQLMQEPLGKILASQRKSQTTELTCHQTYHPAVTMQAVENSSSLRDFWEGHKTLPILPKRQATIPAILIKLQSDYPKFWHTDVSFVKTMENIYQRIRKNIS